MEAISTCVIDAQEQTTAQKSDQSALNMPNKQSTNKPTRDNNADHLFTTKSPENSAHHIPSNLEDIKSAQDAVPSANGPRQLNFTSRSNARDLSVLQANRGADMADYWTLTPQENLR